MAKDAPDPRAQALADRLQGKPSPESEITNMLAQSVSVGQRDEEGRPIGEKVTAEEFRNQQSTRRRKPVRDDDDADDDVVSEEEGDEEEFTDDEEGGEEEGDDLDSDEEEEDADDEEESADEEDGDYEEVTIDDDDVVEVRVDGETEEVSLRELKRIYSLRGATDKRLKEATELRKTAQAEREAASDEIQTHRTKMLHTIQQLDGVLFPPIIPEPDPKLRTRNMNEYLLQKDAYEADQKRIVTSREELKDFLAKEQNTLAENRMQFRQSQQKILAEKMPELTDPVKAPKIQQDIMMAAGHYGFSPEMVASVDHHGLFLMARDAARWLNMQKIKQNGGVPTGRETTTLKRKRHLKSGGTTSTKLALVKSQKQQKTTESKARQTGRVDDIANMLVSKARTVKGRKHGRTG